MLWAGFPAGWSIKLLRKLTRSQAFRWEVNRFLSPSQLKLFLAKWQTSWSFSLHILYCDQRSRLHFSFYTVSRCVLLIPCLPHQYKGSICHRKMAQMGKKRPSRIRVPPLALYSPACTQKSERCKDPQIVCSQLIPSLIHHAPDALLCQIMGIYLAISSELCNCKKMCQ